jgi:hypothetical protein
MDDQTKYVTLPLVTKRFADELMRLCEDELDFAKEGTIYAQDLLDFIEGVSGNMANDISE